MVAEKNKTLLSYLFSPDILLIFYVSMTYICIKCFVKFIVYIYGDNNIVKLFQDIIAINSWKIFLNYIIVDLKTNHNSISIRSRSNYLTFLKIIIKLMT